MKKRLIIHPALFAVFPFLFFYAHNIQDLQQLRAVWVALVVGASVGLAFLAWRLFRFLFKDRTKAALAATILIFILFFYGHLYSLLEDRASTIAGHGYLIPAVLVAFGLCVYLIRRAHRDFGTITRALNVVAVVLIAMNAGTVISHEVSAHRAASAWTYLREDVTPPEVDFMPDIYFIILDEYAHHDTIKEHYGYDNKQFVEGLEEMGFFVARNSTTHTDRTARAVASILNMEYAPETEPLRAAWRRINQNRVIDYFQAIGYTCIYFGHYHELGRYEINADVYFNYYEDADYEPLMAEMASYLLKSPAFGPFHDSIGGERYEEFYREGLLNTLDHLGEVHEMEGPKFVFAHIMAPHVPFVVGPDGEHVEAEHFYNYDDEEFYLGQYIYITQEITGIIDNLLDQSATEPVIILQSDHGPRWVEGWEKILNAFYLPENDHELLCDSISPVDTFRLIFNHYFDAGLEPAEDGRA